MPENEQSLSKRPPSLWIRLLQLAGRLFGKKSRSKSPALTRRLRRYSEWVSEKRRLAELKLKHESTGTPLQVHIDFVRNVTEWDARAYALGVIDKLHLSSVSYLGLFPFHDGFIYEAQEGGNGLALTPSILEYYLEREHLATPDNPITVYLRTGIRTVLVELSPAGIVSMVLPEGMEVAPTSEIVPHGKLEMIVARPELKLLWISGLFLVAALFVFGSASALRPRQTLPFKTTLEYTQPKDLPALQWKSLMTVDADKQVATIRYKNGTWSKETKSKPVPLPSPALVPKEDLTP